MPEDPKWELALLATVQSFYQKLLSDSLGAIVPIPRSLEPETVSSDAVDVRRTLAQMQVWLKVLDMAVTPAMLRQALNAETDPEVAEALLRYFVRARTFTDTNRDKTDLVGTFLYRHPRVPGPEHQVVGVREDDLRAGAVHIPPGDRLHAPRRTDRHEGGGLDGAVSERQAPAPRGRRCVGGEAVEAKGGRHSRTGSLRGPHALTLADLDAMFRPLLGV